MKELRLMTVAEAIEKSGNFSGAMPAEFRLGMAADQRACEEALRLVVTMTKCQLREMSGLIVPDATLPGRRSATNPPLQWPAPLPSPLPGVALRRPSATPARRDAAGRAVPGVALITPLVVISSFARNPVERKRRAVITARISRDA